MYRINGNAGGPVGQSAMNIHVNPYDQSYLYSTANASAIATNSGHISMSPYSTTGTTGGHSGHIYSSGTTLNRHINSGSGGHSSITNHVSNSGNVVTGACSSGNLVLNQAPSTSLLHSVTSSPVAVAAVTSASTGATSMTSGNVAIGHLHHQQISSSSPCNTSPATQLTGRTNSTHGLTGNLLHSSHPHHQQAPLSQSPAVVFNGGGHISGLGVGVGGGVGGSVSNSNDSTHQMLPSTLDTSSPSDAPQKKTFYVLIILIAIGITVMVITVITAIVIFFKYSEKIDLVHKKPLGSSVSHLNRDSNKISSSNSIGLDSNGDAQDPCTKLSCHQHGMDCTIDSSTSEASCFCPITICPPYKLPVCGSDGITYESECHFIKNKCLLLHSYLYPSSSSSVQLSTSSSQALQLNQLSSVDSDANTDLILEPVPANELPPKSSELTAVPFVFDPGQSKINSPAALGTGSNSGLTSKSNLPNVIKITSQVTSPVNLTIVSRGSCPSDACNNVTCPFNGICHSQPGLKELTTCQCPDCPEVHSPVCGSDGTTYVNECFVRKQSCKNQINITVRHDGYCKGCQEITCPHYSKCQFDVRTNLAECLCPSEACVRPAASSNDSTTDGDSEQLTKYYDQMVCASDGQTYSSVCQMEKKSCEIKVTIKVLYYGPCDPCKDVKCNFGASCKDGQCICPTDCPDLIEPVCVKSALVNAYGNQDKQLTIHHNTKQVSGASVASKDASSSSSGKMFHQRKSYNYQSECEMRSSACKHEIQLDYDSLIYGQCPDDSNDDDDHEDDDDGRDEKDGGNGYGGEDGEDDDQVISSTVAVAGRKFQSTNKSSSNTGTSNSGNDATDQVDPSRVNVLPGASSTSSDSNGKSSSSVTYSASSSSSSSSPASFGGSRIGIMNSAGKRKQPSKGRKNQAKINSGIGTYPNGNKKTAGNGKFVDESSDPLEHTSGQLASLGKMKPTSSSKTNEDDDEDVDPSEDTEDDLDEDESDEDTDHQRRVTNQEQPPPQTPTTGRRTTGHKDADTDDELVDHTQASNSRRINGKKKYSKVTSTLPGNLNIAASREDDEDELSSSVNGRGDGEDADAATDGVHGNNNDYNKGMRGRKVSSKLNSRPNYNRNKSPQTFTPGNNKKNGGHKNKSSSKGPGVSKGRKGLPYPPSSPASSSIFSFSPSPLSPTVSTNGSSITLNRQIINSNDDDDEDDVDDDDDIDDLIAPDDIDDDEDDEFDEEDDEENGNNNINSKTINFSFKDNRIGDFSIDLTDEKWRSFMEVECRKLNCPIGAMCKLKGIKSSTSSPPSSSSSSSSSINLDGKSVQTYCDCDLMCLRVAELNLDTPEWKLKGPICASNGILYSNECEYHRASCLIEYSAFSLASSSSTYSSSSSKPLTILSSVNSCTVNYTSINNSSFPSGTKIGPGDNGNGESVNSRGSNNSGDHNMRHAGHRARGNNNKLDGQLNNNNINGNNNPIDGRKEDEYLPPHNTYNHRSGNGRGQSVLGHGDNLDPRGLEEDDSDDEDDLDESLDPSNLGGGGRKSDAASSSSSTCPCNKYGSLNPDCSDISNRIRRPYPPYYHGLVNGTTFQGSPVSSLASLSSNSPLPQCICRPGVGGKYCDRCNADYWGLHKILSHNVPGCLPCDCNVNGSVRSDCEQMTGRCVCKPGVLGIKCDECPSGRILTVYGCTDESIFRPVPKSCSQMVCLFGARCREMKDHHHNSHHHRSTSSSNGDRSTSKDSPSTANSFAASTSSNSSPASASTFDRSNNNNNNNNNLPSPNSFLLTTATSSSSNSLGGNSVVSNLNNINSNSNSSSITTRAQCVCDGLCDPLTSSSSSSSSLSSSSLSSSSSSGTSFSLHSTLPSLGWYSSPSIDVHQSPSDQQSLLLQHQKLAQQLPSPLVLTSLSNVNNGNKNLLYPQTPDPPSVINLGSSSFASPASPLPLSPLYTWWYKDATAPAFNTAHHLDISGHGGHRRLKRYLATSSQASNPVTLEVCGSNGITYPSECELRLHSCRIQESIIVVSKGPCKNAY